MKTMKHTLFSERMKLADLLLTNYRLLYVFPCFDIELGVGERTVAQVCQERNISTTLFLLVCNVHTFDEYHPDINVLLQIPLEDLMWYLRRSHNEYLERRMPKILRLIEEMTADCQLTHKHLLSDFCEKYRQEVITHFNYEEHTVFPYISALLRGEKLSGYKIKEYESNHTDLDAALNDLKNILIKYLPKECSTAQCREILVELSLFELDLHKHTILEDRILISLVERIEKGTL